MKLQFQNSHNSNKIPLLGYNKGKQEYKSAYLSKRKIKDNSIENNRENLSKLQFNRPAQAISFSGSAVSSASKLSEKIIESNGLNKLVHTVNENEVAFNAIYSLIIAGMLKPGLVLAQTGFDDKDGQMIATKNFIQAFTGSFLGLTLGGGFVKKIYDTMSNNLKLIDAKKDGKNITLSIVDKDSDRAKEVAKDVLKKENSKFKDKWANAKSCVEKENGFWNKTKAFFKGIQKSNYKPTEKEISEKADYLIHNLKSNHLPLFEKNKNFTYNLIENMHQLEVSPSALRKASKNCKSQLSDSFESFWKNSTGIVTAISKAKISSFLLPIVVTALFAKRNIEAQQEKENKAKNASTITNSKAYQNQKSKFDKVTNNQKINFKGSLLNTVIDSSAQFVEKLAMSNTGENCVNALSKYSSKPSARMGDIESIGLTIYWIINTSLSKKIDPDQKMGLNAHTGLVTVVSSAAAFLLDLISDPIIGKLEDTYNNKLTNIVNDYRKTTPKNKATNENISSTLKENASKLFNLKGITEKLSDKELLYNEAEVKKAIEGLSYQYSKKLAKTKSLLIFTMVVRFLVPVLTVKQSKKLKKWLVEFSKKMDAKKVEKSKDKNTQETQKA